MAQQNIAPWQYWLSVGFSGLLTVGGAALILFGINFLWEGYASKKWSVASGEIQSVHIKRDISRSNTTTTERHYLTITYHYEVEGIRYTGDRYSLGDGSTASKRFSVRSQAIAEKAKYPIGGAIAVYYKPTEPSSAILKPGINWGTTVPLILGLFFFPSGMAFLVLLLRYLK